jgi:DNA-binding PadR family transcriptional regulator
MSGLSKQEEQILLAVWRLGDKAYAIPIREYLKEVTGQQLSIGGIYIPLDRLVRKTFLEAYQSEPLPERGGMSRRYYRLTPEGIRILKEARRIHDVLWKNLPELADIE